MGMNAGRLTVRIGRLALPRAAAEAAGLAAAVARELEAMLRDGPTAVGPAARLALPGAVVEVEDAGDVEQVGRAIARSLHESLRAQGALR